MIGIMFKRKQEEFPVNKRVKGLSIGFSIFLFLCTIINFVSGHIGAAIGGLGAGIFYLSLSLGGYENIKSKMSK